MIKVNYVLKVSDLKNVNNLICNLKNLNDFVHACDMIKVSDMQSMWRDQGQWPYQSMLHYQGWWLYQSMLRDQGQWIYQSLLHDQGQWPYRNDYIINDNDLIKACYVTKVNDLIKAYYMITINNFLKPRTRARSVTLSKDERPYRINDFIKIRDLIRADNIRTEVDELVINLHYLSIIWLNSVIEVAKQPFLAEVRGSLIKGKDRLSNPSDCLM